VVLRLDAAAKTVVVKLADGTEKHTFHFLEANHWSTAHKVLARAPRMHFMD